MSLPYFPMYPKDFEAKTSHLTLAEDGAFNRLLRICWMTPDCTMPDDEAWIMRRARAVSDADQDVVRAVLKEFFTAENGRLSNARICSEFEAVNLSYEKRKNAGKAGGRAKALQRNKKASSNATAMLKQPEPEPEPEPDIRSRDAKASLVELAPDASQAFDAYNRAAGDAGWPVVQVRTAPRVKALRARLQDCGGIDGWIVAIDKAKASDFLCGRSGDQSWRFTFDWLVKAANFAKLMEGNYDNRDSDTPGRGKAGKGSGMAQALASIAAREASRRGGCAAGGGHGDGASGPGSDHVDGSGIAGPVF